MEVLTHALDELLLDQFCATFNLDLIWKLLVDVILILTEHQIGYFTSVQDIVYILKERLHQNLRISHCEGNFLAHDS